MHRDRAGMLLVAALAISCGGSSASVSPAVRLNAADVAWNDGPPSLPGGAKIAVLEGDPKKPTFFTMRLKLPSGARLAPHTHPADERVTVMSGSVHVGFGEKFDPTQGKVFTAGAFYVNPTPLPHFLWTEEGCVLQMTGIGPWRISYIEDPPGDH